MNDTFVKNEVLNSLKREEQDAFLAALVALGGEITIKGKEISLDFVTYNSDIAIAFCNIVKDNFRFDCEVEIKQREDKRYNRFFLVKLPDNVAPSVLEFVELLKFDQSGWVSKTSFGVLPRIKDNEKSFAGYIKGLFLMKGKVFLYEKNYLVELVLPSENFAEEIAGLLLKYGINSSVIAEKSTINIKAGESVSDFFALCGAGESSLELKDILIEREMRNKINREANCEAANSDRNASASVKQVNAIIKIFRANQKDKLSKELLEVAEYKIKYPEAPLSQIAKHFGLSKSGISHRINKIISIAEDIKEG